ncbi:MAG: hypothetical protein SOX68_10705 [Faecalicoccus sp.]|nr:hypothetical protein [Faecalicoccus sp.]MDY4670435.1 hypothetical protein [Oliverpabstia sp.]
MMTKDEIVDHMISYIETVEKDLQASKTSSDGKTVRTDVVKGILDELERMVNDEN